MSLIRHAAKLAFVAFDLFLPSPKGPRILIYHQVGAGLGRQMEVTVEQFQRQLDWLAENREVVDLETAIEHWEEEGSDRLVVLSFDDGYRDTYTTAFPMLKERGFPFTLYLTTKPIETGRALGPSPKADPLSWPQVEEMLGSGLVTVGSHTHRHVDIRLLDGKEVEEELLACDRLIEARTGVSPRHFAYPWGYWSAQADALIRTMYGSATLGPPVSGRSPVSDPYRMHRYPIQLSDSMRWFEARLQGGLFLEERMRRRLRGYTGP